MRRRLVCAALCLAATPAVSTSLWAAPNLAGIWFGQGQPGDRQSMYLDRLTADGRIHSRFRDCRNGKPLDSTEDGTWSLAGSTLTIQINFHNGQLMPRTDIYHLDSASPRDFRITYLLMNFGYDERRVDDKFEMPSCQLVS
jgi:hypothetical protein